MCSVNKGREVFQGFLEKSRTLLRLYAKKVGLFKKTKQNKPKNLLYLEP